MKHALILGVSGQDGAYLAWLLLEKGYRVSGTSRNVAVGSFDKLDALGIRQDVALHELSPADVPGTRELLAALAPDEVYNLAGQSSPGLSFERPLETFESLAMGTMAVLEALRLLKGPARLFNASSSECFGDTGRTPATEGTPFAPRSPYAVGKAAATFAVASYRQAFGLHVSSGILFNHESPLRPVRFVTRKIVAAVARIKAGSDECLHLGNIDVARDWGYAPEYVQAMWLMLQQDRPDDYIIATGQTIPLRKFIQEAFAAVDLDWRDHVRIDPALYRPADIVVSRADPGKAERVLGWKATMDPAAVARALVRHEQNVLAGENSAL